MPDIKGQLACHSRVVPLPAVTLWVLLQGPGDCHLYGEVRPGANQGLLSWNSA